MLRKILKNLTILLAVGTAWSSYGQNSQNYRPGYVVLNSGDTLRGTVMDRDESSFGGLLNKVILRPEKGHRKKYKPKDISSYARDSQIFRSMWVSSETQMFRTQYFDRPGQGEQVFLKVIYQGSLEVYHWEFNDEDNFTIDFFPLIRKAGSEELVRATQGIFGLKRQRLAEYFADCLKLAAAITGKEISTVEEIIELYDRSCLPYFKAN